MVDIQKIFPCSSLDDLSKDQIEELKEEWQRLERVAKRKNKISFHKNKCESECIQYVRKVPTIVEEQEVGQPLDQSVYQAGRMLEGLIQKIEEQQQQQPTAPPPPKK